MAAKGYTHFESALTISVKRERGRERAEKKATLMTQRRSSTKVSLVVIERYICASLHSPLQSVFAIRHKAVYLALPLLSILN